MHLNLGKFYQCLQANIKIKYFYQLNFVTTCTRDGDILLNYKDKGGLLTSPSSLKLMDNKNKETVYNFASKLVSKIYRTHSINRWLIKRKGEIFIDLITATNIAYTVAVVENSYEYWNQCFALKNMTHNEHETYMESEGYIKKKSKIMQQVGRQRQHSGMG